MHEIHLSEVRIDPMTSDARSSWLSSIMVDVKSANNSQPHGPKIQKVPNALPGDKNQRMECYHPLAVSIGPYHYSDRGKKLKEVESLKIAMTRQFVRDTGEPIELLYSKIKEVAENARGFYAEGSTDGFDQEQFAQMMFLDGCFILQFIHCVNRNNPDNLEMSDQQVAYVTRDLLLLENQLPFLVLESLMKLRYGNDDGMNIIYDFLFFKIGQPEPQSLPIWARRLLVPWFLLLFLSCALILFFVRIAAAGIGIILAGGVILLVVILSLPLRLLSVRMEKKKKKKNMALSGHHLLELLYFMCRGSPKVKPKPSDAPIGSRGHRLNYSAKELMKVGIHFSPDTAGALSDVTFKSSGFYGTLNLPPIAIDEFTEDMLLNLVAYETSAAHEQPWVPSYICFLDSLIDDAEDVTDLRSKGILFNYLGPDKQVADLMNRMGRCFESKNIGLYNDVKRDIIKQSQGMVSKWAAEWHHAYFSSPWAFTTFVATGVGLALTATEAYFTIYPPKVRIKPQKK